MSIVSDELIEKAEAAAQQIIEAFDDGVAENCDIRTYRPDTVYSRNSGNVLTVFYGRNVLFYIKQMINRFEKATGVLYVTLTPYSGSQKRYNTKKDGTFNTAFIAEHLRELIDVSKSRAEALANGSKLLESAKSAIDSIFDSDERIREMHSLSTMSIFPRISRDKENNQNPTIILGRLSLNLNEAELLRIFLLNIIQSREKVN